MEMSFEQATSMIKYNAERRGEQRGEERGIITGKLETAANLLSKGLPLELIIETTGLKEKQITEYVSIK